jgi:TetR/AcrR family transcriptional regulator, regulator of cefoperazone and chloramphenicol sensitivity
MVPVKRPKKSRDRLLNAACKVFGKKGYRDAKIADICRQAGANVAAVNYYFGSKAVLYAEAWKQAFEKDIIPDPLDAIDATPEERLCARIRALVRKFCDRGAAGQFTRMYLMELANPTGLIGDNWRELIEPRRRHLLGIIRDLIGTGATDEDIWFCELSIINQCRALLMLNRSDLEYLVQQPLTPALIQRLADHITRFSLAGIHAIRIKEKACFQNYCEIKRKKGLKPRL